MSVSHRCDSLERSRRAPGDASPLHPVTNGAWQVPPVLQADRCGPAPPVASQGTAEAVRCVPEESRRLEQSATPGAGGGRRVCVLRSQSRGRGQDHGRNRHDVPPVFQSDQRSQPVQATRSIPRAPRRRALHVVPSSTRGGRDREAMPAVRGSQQRTKETAQGSAEGLGWLSREVTGGIGMPQGFPPALPTCTPTVPGGDRDAESGSNTVGWPVRPAQVIHVHEY